MTKIPFVKMQAVGNDFVLIDARKVGELNWEELVPKLCHRPWGIGADGLLLVGPGQVEAVRMRMWNPDGSEDFCGNGLRCAAKYAFEHGITDQTDFTIEAYQKLVKVSLCIDGDGNVDTITLDMGEPEFDPHKIPMLNVVNAPVIDLKLPINSKEYSLTVLSTGTTHTIIFTDNEPEDEEFFSVSPMLENHPHFPDRTSVMWVTVMNPKRISMRIWERGVGETLGCGTGAAAAVVAAKLHHWTEDEVEVVSKGGVVRVNWRPDERIRLTGDAQYVFEGSFLNDD